MDNDAFRSTYRAVNERYCPYEKSILTNSCGCSMAHRFCIAEREGVQCSDDQAQETCLHLLGLLRRQARFALKSTDTESALPHAKAMRIQVGGLRGLRKALAPDQSEPGYIDDIRATILAAIARFGSLEQLPFPAIMQQIAAYQGRRPSHRRGR